MQFRTDTAITQRKRTGFNREDHAESCQGNKNDRKDRLHGYGGFFDRFLCTERFAKRNFMAGLGVYAIEIL